MLRASLIGLEQATNSRKRPLSLRQREGGTLHKLSPAVDNERRMRLSTSGHFGAGIELPKHAAKPDWRLLS